jgi:hypothetical protein
MTCAFEHAEAISTDMGDAGDVCDPLRIHRALAEAGLIGRKRTLMQIAIQPVETPARPLTSPVGALVVTTISSP